MLWEGHEKNQAFVQELPKTLAFVRNQYTVYKYLHIVYLGRYTAASRDRPRPRRTLRANPAPSWWPTAFRQWHSERDFSYLYWYCDVWTNFWPLWKLKTSHVLSSRIWIFEKGPLGSAIRYGSTKNFEQCFWYRIENVARYILVYSVICARKTAPWPWKHCFWDGLNLRHWMHVEFLRSCI